MENWMIWLVVIIPVVQLVLILVDERVALGFMGFSLIGLLLLTSDDVNMYAIGIILTLQVISSIVGVLFSVKPEVECVADEVFFLITFAAWYVIIYFGGALFFIEPMINNFQYNKNVIAIEEPQVETVRYELFDVNAHSNRCNESVSNIVYFEGDKKSYYIIYCDAPSGDKNYMYPFYIEESKLEIIIQSDGVEAFDTNYLLVINETYFKEDRNKKPYEKVMDYKNVRYELYVSQNTFSRKRVIKQ